MQYEKAKAIVQRIIDERYKDHNRKIIIDPDYSFEFKIGWVFLYNTENYIKDRKSQNYLLVSIPILVDKIDKILYKLYDPKRSFIAPEKLIDDYIIKKEQQKEKDRGSEKKYYKA